MIAAALQPILPVLATLTTLQPTGLPASADADGRWVYFHTQGPPEYRQRLFYDRLNTQRRGNRVTTQWKVWNEASASTTFYGLDIFCADNVATETGTQIVESDGRVRIIPRPERLQRFEIQGGSSTAVFAAIFCAF